MNKYKKTEYQSELELEIGFDPAKPYEITFYIVDTHQGDLDGQEVLDFIAEAMQLIDKKAATISDTIH